MIKGIGVDIIEIARIQQSIESTGDRFLEKIFTPREIEYCKSKQNAYQHFAARFAAKEAVSKAMSTGWDKEFIWKDVEVMNDPSGQPRVTLHGRAEERLEQYAVHLSLSHSDSHVVAMVLIDDKIRQKP